MSAFKTADDLKDAIANWLNRGDLEDEIPQFIRLFEAQFESDPRAKIQPRGVISTAETDDGFFPLPADFVDMDRLRDIRTGQNLEYVTPMEIGGGSASGGPATFTIEGWRIRVHPAPSSTTTFEMLYYARLPSLTEHDTNWVYKQHPDLYLYGSLLQAEPFLKNEERVGVWRQFYDRAMDDLRVTDQRSRHPGPTLSMKTRSFG